MIIPILFAIGIGTSVICAAKCKSRAILIRKNGEGRPLVRVNESIQSLDVVVFEIEEMTCFEITYAIYRMLMDTPGVKEVNTKHRYKWAAIVFDPEIVREGVCTAGFGKTPSKGAGNQA